MGQFRKLAERIPLWDAMLSFGSRFGIWAVLWNVVAIFWALTVTVWAYLWSNVPGWGLALIFTAALALSLICTSKGMSAWRDFVVARAMSKFDPTQYKAFGAELVKLADEIFRFLAERQRDHADIHRASPAHQGADREAWQADRDFEQVTGKLFFEKFGTKVLGAMALLHRIGIEFPPHMVTSAHHRPNGLPQILGLMGDLLSRGNIDDAIQISQDRSFMWQVQH